MLEKGKKVSEYVLLEKLGAGGFGEVWKAEKRTEFSVSYFAIKFFRPKDNEEIDVEAVKREVATWQRLNGLQNVISVIEANRFEDYVYIVSEFAEGGSLDRWLKTNGGKANSTEEAVRIALQILQGLEGMHGEGFVHRDLKPANVLLKRNIFYLADFGISRQMKTHSKTTGTAGTYEFMPPEAFEKNPSVSVHTDIWAVGAILQKLLTGHLPFPQDEMPSLITAILMSEPEPLPESVPLALREIVRKALQKKREDRFQTASEMQEALQNVLIQQKFAASQMPSQAETIADNQKTEKYEIAPTQDFKPPVEEVERPTELREDQTEIRTVVRQQIREASGQRDEEVTRQKAIDYQALLNHQTAPQSSTGKSKIIGIGAAALLVFFVGLIGLVVWSNSRNTISQVTNSAANTTTNNSVNRPANNSTASSTPDTFKNSIGMEFVKIPAGSFMMGSPAGEGERSDNERPQHQVTISKDFYLGKYEVTQGQWKAVMGNNPSFFEDCGDICPVENVSWDDVQKFIKKLNAKGEGTYRLPTEAEWEYACRAGTTGAYSGNNRTELGWHFGNSDGKTHPVGQKEANAFGLYDMHGNVWEWTADWYGVYSNDSVVDPKGASSGSERVARGGSRNDVVTQLRSANRYSNLPSFRINWLGFRVVRQ